MPEKRALASPLSATQHRTRAADARGSPTWPQKPPWQKNAISYSTYSWRPNFCARSRNCCATQASRARSGAWPGVSLGRASESVPRRHSASRPAVGRCVMLGPKSLPVVGPHACHQVDLSLNTPSRPRQALHVAQHVPSALGRCLCGGQFAVAQSR